MERPDLTVQCIVSGLRSRLRAGIYPPGTSLPPIGALQKEFRAGRQTVRSAVSMLCAERIVECEPRKCARAAVAGDTPPETVLADRRNLLAYSYAAAYLLPPVLSQLSKGARRRRHLSETSPSAALQTCLQMILAGGTLFRSLFELLIRHSFLPFFCVRCPGLEDLASQLNRTLAATPVSAGTIRRLLTQGVHTVRDTIRTLVSSNDVVPEPLPLDLDWHPAPALERKHLFILLETSARIGTEAYPPGCYLPSEARLASHYSVSVSTIREAIRGLEQFGLTQTINGRGTRILEKPVTQNLRISLAPGGLLDLIPQAARLLSMILPSCARDTARRNDQEAVRSLFDLSRNERGIPMRALFRYVATTQRTPLLRLVLSRLGTLCDWGVLVAASDDRPAARASLRERSQRLLALLAGNSYEDFAAGLGEVYLETYKALSGAQGT